MFDSLTSRLSRTVDALRGRGRITEDNVAEVLREVRVALLEADVALPVIKQFIEPGRAQARGTGVSSSLPPGRWRNVLGPVADLVGAGAPAVYERRTGEESG